MNVQVFQYILDNEGSCKGSVSTPCRDGEAGREGRKGLCAARLGSARLGGREGVVCESSPSSPRGGNSLRQSPFLHAALPTRAPMSLDQGRQVADGASPTQVKEIEALVNAPTTDLQKRNWKIHLHYTRGEYADCLTVIERQLKATKGLCEYALYVKALIRRQEGKIEDSLQLFQAATCLSPMNVANLKQVARSLYLLGKHKAAIEVYDEAMKSTQLAGSDWEVWHNKGLCLTYLRRFDEAIAAFKKANSLQRHDVTFMQLGKVYTLQEDYAKATEVYLDALEFSPENPEILTTLGLLYLRQGENYKAFDYLGNSLTHDRTNPETILAAGSIMQDHQDNDTALIKYRISAQKTPNSAQLWNNVGMCFFGKEKYVASIACLKRALYLDPFQYIIAYNLGLVHLTTGQYASAFHHFSSSINLKADYSCAYMYLAVTLVRLEDLDNACQAYEKAIDLDPDDHLAHLNYAISLYNMGQADACRKHYAEFERLFDELDEETQNADEDVLEMREALVERLR